MIFLFGLLLLLSKFLKHFNHWHTSAIYLNLTEPVQQIEQHCHCDCSAYAFNMAFAYALFLNMKACVKAFFTIRLFEFQYAFIILIVQFCWTLLHSMVFCDIHGFLGRTLATAVKTWPTPDAVATSGAYSIDPSIRSCQTYSIDQVFLDPHRHVACGLSTVSSTVSDRLVSPNWCWLI